MATTDFKTGDKASWNSTQGKMTGTVKKKLTAPMDIKTHHVAASHKPAALKRVKAVEAANAKEGVTAK